MPKRYKTDTPRITDAEIALIRAAAHRYLLAGGYIFRSTGDDASFDEYVGNIVERFTGTGVSDALNNLIDARVPDYTPHEELYVAAWRTVDAHTEAGYLFGVCVGLELAALTVGQFATIPTLPSKPGKRAQR